MRACWWPLTPALLTLLAPVLLTGCGGATPGGLASTGNRSEPRIQGEAFPQPLAASAEARAEETDFRSRRALRLSNGLVTVVALPSASGRLVSLRLGEFEYLRTDLAPTAPPSEQAATDSGGDLATPVAEAKPDESPSLSAAWKGEILTARGIYAEVKLTSPEPRPAGLQLSRTLRLYAGSTRLTVTDTLTNSSDQPARWSLQTTTRLTGLIGTGAPRGQVRLYAPLAPAPDHPEGFWPLEKESDTSQFSAPAQHRLLEVTYNGLPGQVALGPGSGWLAYTENGGNHALVRRLQVSTTGDYPNGAPTRLRLAPAEQGVAYVELLTAAPYQDLRPTASLTLTQDWYATVVPGPVVDTSDQAAICEPLVLKSPGEGFRLTGRLGVFAPGTLLLSPINAAGQTLGVPLRLPVTPGEPVVLDQSLPARPGLAGVQLALENPAGTPLAALASVSLPSPAG